MLILKLVQWWVKPVQFQNSNSGAIPVLISSVTGKYTVQYIVQYNALNDQL